MKRFSILLALILTLGLTFSAHDAEAKRLGGGTSSGMSRSSSVMQRSAAPAPAPSTPSQNISSAPRPAQPVPPPAPAPSGMSRWLGPLAGIAAGVGIASLFSHFGMGGMSEGMGSLLMMLVVGGVIFLVVRMLMQRNAPQPYPGQFNQPTRFEPQGDAYAAPATAPANGAATPGNLPPGFDAEGFLRQAKLNFVRLQAANDAGNMEDIRAFTTPEMFAEVQLEYQERSRATQQTDIVQLNAALLDLTSEGARQIASVRFSGSIRETAGAAPEAFDEVWHLTRPADASSGWIIAGIQQMN
jgi:predicted lipid-binding transport protein (Tim44 family)